MQDATEQVQEAHVQMPAKEEQNIVEQEHQAVVQYQMDITQQDVMVQEINVQDNHNVQQVTIVQMVYQMPVVLVNGVVQEQQDVVPFLLDVTEQVLQQDVQLPVKVEQNIVDLELPHVVQYQMDTTQQDAMALVMDVLEYLDVHQVTIVQAE